MCSSDLSTLALEVTPRDGLTVAPALADSPLIDDLRALVAATDDRLEQGGRVAEFADLMGLYRWAWTMRAKAAFRLLKDQSFLLFELRQASLERSLELEIRPSPRWEPPPPGPTPVHIGPPPARKINASYDPEINVESVRLTVEADDGGISHREAADRLLKCPPREKDAILATLSRLQADTKLLDDDLLQTIAAALPALNAQEFRDRVEADCKAKFAGWGYPAARLRSPDKDEVNAIEKVFAVWLTPPPDYVAWDGWKERAIGSSVLKAGEPLDSLTFLYESKLVLTPYERPLFLDGKEAHGWQGVLPSADPKLDAFRRVPADVMTRVGRFVRFQRVFRAALNGTLGEDFPVEKMIRLGEELAAPPKPPAAR